MLSIPKTFTVHTQSSILHSVLAYLLGYRHLVGYTNSPSVSTFYRTKAAADNALTDTHSAPYYCGKYTLSWLYSLLRK